MKSLLKHPLFITFVIYVSYILIVFPFGQFAVNDDWVFKLQVMAFNKGIWGIHASIDPSFILHALLGVLWAKVFGVTFVSLRILIMVQSFLVLFGVYKIFLLYKKYNPTILFFLLLVLANPLFLVSSFTFMTEISFLLFTIWSIYFILRYQQSGSLWDVLFAGLLTGGSILIRQSGVVLFIAFALTKKFKKSTFLYLLLIVGFIAVWILWPRFDVSGQMENGLLDTFSKVVRSEQLIGRLKLFLFSFSYIGFFILPFSLTRKKRALPFFIAVPLAIYIFSIDIFATGNIFYLEGLYIKTVYSVNFSLFDNLITKFFVAYLNSYSLIVFVLWLGKNINKLTFEKFLLLSFLGHVSIIFLGNDFYERYLFVATILLIVIIGIATDKVKFSKVAIVGFVILFTITGILQKDYYSQTKLRWSQATKIHKLTNLTNQIYVDGTYRKYARALKMNDFTGVRSAKAGGHEYMCFVQKYTLDTNSKILKITQGADEFFKQYIKNPRVFGSRKPQGFPKVKNNLDKLIFNDEYFSPLYNLVGKQAFVGSWCNE